MQGKITNILSKVDSSLLEKPHILSHILDVLTRKRQLIAAERKRMREHLTNCIHCQVFLWRFLAETIKYDQEHGILDESGRKLLAQLTRIIHETLKDAIPRYVEVLEGRGEEEANKQFPILEEHLKNCRICQYIVEGTRSWLRQAVEEGLIAPLEADGST